MVLETAEDLFKREAKEYAVNVLGDNKEKTMCFERFISSCLVYHKSEMADVYRDIKHISDKCKYCSYTTAKPVEGSFLEKTDNYLKERSKWAILLWGIIGSLAVIIGSIYIYWFMLVATTVFEIKEVVIKTTTQIEINNTRINRLEKIYFKDNVK